MRSAVYRILTIGREYGSGGGPVAELVAKQMGWQLLDEAIVQKVAEKARVHPGIASRFDECLDSWMHRLTKRTLGRGAFEGVSPVGLADMFDADAMAGLSRRLIEEAAEIGNCVIVGRGAQCILQHRDDAFHVFVYAPLAERIRRIRKMYGDEHATAENVEAMDRRRNDYIEHHFGANWRDPHLYHSMLCGACGDEAVALAIRAMMGVVKEPGLVKEPSALKNA
ncbi:MAG TPA: cytidylate kinase-like family protein [Bryobacteraceae bacterium]|nr:cytidylate kinase-like family protein [Bryobacteraceae bacterium]